MPQRHVLSGRLTLHACECICTTGIEIYCLLSLEVGLPFHVSLNAQTAWWKTRAFLSILEFVSSVQLVWGGMLNWAALRISFSSTWRFRENRGFVQMNDRRGWGKGQLNSIIPGKQGFDSPFMTMQTYKKVRGGVLLLQSLRYCF